MYILWLKFISAVVTFIFIVVLFFLLRKKGILKRVLIVCVLTFVFIFLQNNIIYYFFLGGENKDKSPVISTIKGAKLYVDIPECNGRKVSDTMFTIHGNWVFINDKVNIPCTTEDSYDYLNFVSIHKKAKSDDMITFGTQYSKSISLVEETGKYKKYIDSRVNQYIVEYVGLDGYKIYIEYNTKDQSNYSVYRRLDDSFEINYVVHKKINNLSDIRDVEKTDLAILAYAKKITRRLK